MDLSSINAKLAAFVAKLNEKGIPLPFIRDNGIPSVSLSLLIATFITWELAIFEVVKNMDIDKIENTLWAMAGLYFGRKVTKMGSNKVDIAGVDKGDQSK